MPGNFGAWLPRDDKDRTEPRRANLLKDTSSAVNAKQVLLPHSPPSRSSGNGQREPDKSVNPHVPIKR